MAKVKSATQRITTYLKAKGYDTADIKDAFDELDAADTDLEQLADSLNKNSQWVNWYNTNIPEIQKAIQERDALSEKLEKLKAAGFETSVAAPAAPVAAPGAGITKEEFERFKNDIASANSQVMKSVARIGFKHYKQYNADPDYDAMEKLIQERKAIDVDDAYEKWSAPMREARQKEDTAKEVARLVKEGIAAERSKDGIRTSNRKKIEAEIGVEIAPLDKPAPNDSDLKEAFSKDWNSFNNVTH